MPTTTATLQTPPGRGGISVILLAGPLAGEILGDVFHPWLSHRVADARALQLGHLVDGTCVIDEAVVCRGVAGVEINIHGGPGAAQATLKLLARHGATVLPAGADPAPFAVPHPRWNNPAVAREMVGALPLADGLLAVSAVTQQWSGGLSALAAATAPAPDDLDRAADALPVMRRLLHPCEVVLAGPPNAGKSTLANALVARQVSIVDAQPGTTRDWVRERALIAGVPVWLTDTAGIWSAPAGIDAEAVARARGRAQQADLVVLLGAGSPIDVPAWLGAKDVLRVAAKCDAAPPCGGEDLAVSAHSGAGMDRLADAILRRLGLGDLDPAAAMAFTPRQAALLARAARALRQGDQPAGRRALRTLLEG